MKLSVSAYRAHASAHKKILSSSYQTTLNYGSTSAAAATSSTSSQLFSMEPTDAQLTTATTQSSCPTTISGGTQQTGGSILSPMALSPGETRTGSMVTSKEDEEDSSNAASSDCKSPGQRTKSNQRWMKLRTTVQLSSAIQKKPPLKREDSFLKRFSTRQIPETQETMEETGSESASGDHEKTMKRRRYNRKRISVVNPDENFYFYWLMVLTFCILYNLWTLIVRQSFPELQAQIPNFWLFCDCLTDIIFLLDIVVQLRTGYLEQGLMVYDDKKLATHYMRSRKFLFDLAALLPLDLLQIKLGTQPLLRFPRFLKVYRSVKFYYIVESRTVWPNLWRVVNLIHILLILAHWFGCFYFLLSEAEGFQGDWVYPYRPGDYATLTRKYLGSLYWSTLTLTTIGDLPTPETNAEYIFTIVSYLIGVFIFATIVGQVGNVITNRNANRLEFERLLDGAKTYMRHHKVPGGMKRRVLRWYDYSWSRGRIQGGGDINTALGLLPDKLKTELALHVNLSVLKKVTIFQECQPEFLHDLVLKMKAYIFTPGDSICRKGEVAREMFIIADGILEVLSETGKVLTTMKAGDFFGEIGILNLDGLNKRTADVRSVGYSELFSLSREDVLAAMKDYPEAQEILQTLGRKRLMEVRCVNKKHATKMAAEKESLSSNVPQAHVTNSSDHRTSKRIVDKLRSDVKGIKNVLRKSRWTTGRRSNESIELQPLQGTIRTPKGVLRRMPRVRSDEMTGDGDDHVDIKEKTPSPIGAGLPLLQRLRLLKEKQDREERAVKPAPPMIPSPQTHVRSAVSPQQSIQEEPEREVLGAGLPLMQRLKLLKAKEERLAKECQNKIQVQSSQSQPQSSSSSTFSAISTITSLKSSATPSTSAGLSPSGLGKPPLKVSFRERIKGLQQECTKSPTEREPKASGEPADMKEQLISGTSFSSKLSKPSTLSIKDKIKQLGHINQPKMIDEQSGQLKPWSKLKMATVVNTGGSYTSLNNSINEESPSDLETIPLKEPSTESGSSRTADKKKVKSDHVSASDSEIKSDLVKDKVPKKIPIPFKIQREPKMYRSVDDLSPEYSGLPFVKKLKILNERQKLAELESVIQTRSFSLDCTESDNGTDLMEPLIRSHSEASGIARPKAIHSGHSGVPVVAPLIIQPCLQSPLSPESNETLERRNLKSILKKLSEEKSQQQCVSGSGDESKPSDMMGLMRAPTVEGYVARHSKFMKSVTFNSTLSSPPNSAHSVQSAVQAVEERSLFPVLSAQNLDTTTNNSDVISDQIDNSTNKLDTDCQESNYLSKYEDGSPKSTPFISKKFIKGSIEEHEYFGEVLLGIKHVIQNHLREVQVKFQDRFLSLELDVRQRDEVITQLQHRIQELEENPSTHMHQMNRMGSAAASMKSGSSGSNDIPFVRGDSVDTIFVSSPPSEYDRSRTKMKSKKRNSPRRTNVDRSMEESSDQDSFHRQIPAEMLRLNRGVMMTDAAGNITEMSQSVVLNIDNSSRTSSSSGESQLDDDYNDNDDEELHCDDWEIRMLAAELNRRESKKDEASSETGSGPDEHGRLLRRRRRKEKAADTDSEISDNGSDHLSRPRAASLDQHNLRRQTSKGVFKAMSFDRDKDRL
ncbi:uncharacterized protein LOC119066502 isoform X2 [Bradysia coprophila]|uniref:uncharacterized protein LOC119066502 isoform X2 n=1 Tax=Bradysia coprophila TaxID=38358 RepID=UPI00187DBDFD|nr:uncharacterized protein LOC119066502 isoform X2 [Bradysia coprophila]